VAIDLLDLGAKRCTFGLGSVGTHFAERVYIAAQ